MKPGDIVFYDRNHNNAMEASDHTFLIGESLNLKYDWGSDASIKHQGNYSSGMPFNFQINCNEFGWAYRMP